LDVAGLLALAAQQDDDEGRLPADAFVGHVHLHVSDLQAERHFYHTWLGLDIVAEFPGAAIFTSAGGYHHHVAFNIWNGRSADQPPSDATGLRWYTLELPTPAGLDAALERLRAAGKVPQKLEEGGWLVRDNAGNGLRLACLKEQEAWETPTSARS
jgi:catechol 2,3-dioxygenase